MEKLESIIDCSKTLKLNYLNANASKIIEAAELKDLSYQDLLLDILKNEINIKDKKAQERLLKNAGFPMLKNI